MQAGQLAVARGRNPFEVFMLAACALSGGTTLAGAGEPSSVERSVAPIVLILWGGALIVGGLLGLGGISMRPPMGLLVERIGMVFLAGPGLAYAVVLMYFGASVAGAVVAAFALAAVWRVAHITVDLQRVRRAAEE